MQDGYQNRIDAMNEGISGGPQLAPQVPPSFIQKQAQLNGGPARVRLTGSMNGMAESQYKATLGGMFGTQNGQAESTYETKKYYPGSM